MKIITWIIFIILIPMNIVRLVFDLLWTVINYAIVYCNGLLYRGMYGREWVRYWKDSQYVNSDIFLDWYWNLD